MSEQINQSIIDSNQDPLHQQNFSSCQNEVKQFSDPSERQKIEILVNQDNDQVKQQLNDDMNTQQMADQNVIMKSAADFKIEIEVESTGQQLTQIAEIMLQSQSSNSSAFNQNPSCPANTQSNIYSQIEEDLQSNSQLPENKSQEIDQSFLSPFSHSKIPSIQAYHQEPFLNIPTDPKSLHDDSFLMELEDFSQDQSKKQQYKSNIESEIHQNNQILNSSESNISTPDTENRLNTSNEKNFQKNQEIFDFVLEKNEIKSESFKGNYDDKNKMEIYKLLENSISQSYSLTQIKVQNESAVNKSDQLIMFQFLNTQQEKVLSVLNLFNKYYYNLFLDFIQVFSNESRNKNIELTFLVQENINLIEKYFQEKIKNLTENYYNNNQQQQEMEVCEQNSHLDKLNQSLDKRQFINFYDDVENYPEGEKEFFKEDDEQNIESIKEQQRIQLFEDERDSILKEPEVHDNQYVSDQKSKNQYEKIIEFDWNPLEKFRAKLYTLDQEGRWHDRGTGNFKIEHIGYQQYKMTLLQEQDNQIDLLKDEIIEPHITFHRQRETIITWSDKQREQDLAVSFQNNSGAQYTWHKICQILDVDPDQNTQDSQNQEEEAEEFSQITLESLPRLADELKNVQSIENEAKQEICDHFLANEAQKLIKLGELFEECENEMKDKPKIAEENLLNFFHIYKGLIQLNDERLLEILMSDKFYMYTFGALEWDPEGLEEVQEVNEKPKEDQQSFQQEPELESLPISDQRALDEISQPEEEFEENKEKLQLNDQMKNEGVFEDSISKNKQPIKYKKDGIDQIKLIQENDQNENDIDKNNSDQKQKGNNESSLIENNDLINQKKIQKYFTTLNYREFLSKTVKFNKVVEFNGQQIKKQESGEKQQMFTGYQEQKSNQFNYNQNQYGNTEQNFDIEERIHINYRLAYLKDTVMARYIDDTALKVINQLIQSNNREIVSIIFGLNLNQPNDNQQYSNNAVYGSIINKSNSSSSYGLTPWGAFSSNQKTIKDQIVEKIKSRTNIKERFQAIEFMIELCQILKSFQFQSNFLGGNPSFQYNNGSIGFNSRQITDQLNHVNLIGLLAESFGIFVPSSETLDAHLNYFQNQNSSYNVQVQEYNNNLIELYQQQNPNMERYVIEDLLEFTKERNEHESQNAVMHLEQHAVTRVDKMKINSMEIIISFYQNTHVPMNDINKFVLGEEQKQRGLPFLNNLVSHLIYSPEQGIKTQICDFFKSLLDCEQSSLNNISSKEQLYKNVLRRFVLFLKQFKTEQVDNKIQNDENENKQYKLTKFKHLEYSIYLIMQILNKVVSEHRYPFKTFMIQNEVIQTVGDLSQIQSKLVNVEIIKFYKSLLKSKDQSYIQMITQKHLFNAVFDIFELNFKQIRPPMILSCIRDLFEHIFRMSMGKNQMNQNELYNQKLVDYLIRINPKSKSIIFNPIYKSIFKKYDLKDIFTNEEGENFIIDENERKGKNNNGQSPQPDSVISPVSPCSDYSDSDLSQNPNENEDCIGIQYSKQPMGPMGLALQQKQQNSFINKRPLSASLQNMNTIINKPIYDGSVSNDFRKSDQINGQKKLKPYEEFYTSQKNQLSENDKLQKIDEKEQKRIQLNEKVQSEIYNKSENGNLNNEFLVKSERSEYRNKYNISLLFGDQFEEGEGIEKKQKGNKSIDVLNQYMQYPLSDDDEDLGGLSPIGLNQSATSQDNKNQFQNDKRFKSVNRFFNQNQPNQFQTTQSKQNHVDNSEFLLDLQNEPEDEVQNEINNNHYIKNQQIQNQINPLQINDILETHKKSDQKETIEEEKFENIERIELENEMIGNDNEINQQQINLKSDNTQNSLEYSEQQLSQQNEQKQNKTNSNTGQSNKQNIQISLENFQSQISDVSQFSQNSPHSFQFDPPNKHSGQKDAQLFEKVSCSSSDHLYNILDDKEIIQDLGIFNIDIQQTYLNKKQQTELNGSQQGHTKLIYRTSKSPGTIYSTGHSKSENGKFKSQIHKQKKDELIKKVSEQKSIDDSDLGQSKDLSEIISESISNQDNMSERQDTVVLDEEIEMSNEDSQPIKLGIKRSFNSSTGEIADQSNVNISYSHQIDPNQDLPLQKRHKTDDQNL